MAHLIVQFFGGDALISIESLNVLNNIEQSSENNNEVDLPDFPTEGGPSQQDFSNSQTAINFSDDTRLSCSVTALIQRQNIVIKSVDTKLEASANSVSMSAKAQ